MEIKKLLKLKSVQFKEIRVKKKVNVFKDKFSKPHKPNQAETRPRFYVTPLVEGKVQFGKMKKRREHESS